MGGQSGPAGGIPFPPGVESLRPWGVLDGPHQARSLRAARAARARGDGRGLQGARHPARAAGGNGAEQLLFRLSEEGSNAGWDVGEAAVSRDARFLALPLGRGDGGAEIRIVPIDGAEKTERDGFVVATDARFLSHPKWSPGGRLVYYLSQRDGPIAVWAQRLDSQTKRPQGEPFLVLRPEGMIRSAELHPRAWLGLDVAPGRLLVTTSRWESNLWAGAVE